MKSLTINGSKRESVGKKATKALRNAGQVPCVLYGGDQPLHFSAEEIADSKESAGIFSELKPGSDAKLTGIETVNGEDVYVISSEDGKSKDYYSTTTGLKLQKSNTEEQMGQTMTSTTTYSNYKAVDGVKIPHSITQSFGHQNM